MGARVEQHFDRDDGDRVFGDQPGFNAAVPAHGFNVDGVGRQGEGQDRQEKGACLGETEHQASSSGRLRTPVTERSFLRYLRAAALTCSGVTASTRSGQVAASSTVRPVERATP